MRNLNLKGNIWKVFVKPICYLDLSNLVFMLNNVVFLRIFLTASFLIGLTIGSSSRTWVKITAGLGLFFGGRGAMSLYLGF